MDPPHKTCNWLLPNVLVGTLPTQDNIQHLLRANVTIFVNLIRESEGCWYHNLLPPQVKFLHFPIKGGKTPRREALEGLVRYLARKSQDNIIYIHCRGGNGRAGMVAAVLYGRVREVKAAAAIRAVEQSRNTRPDKSRNFIPTPETYSQVELIGSILGVAEDDPLPLRRDKNWLRKLKSLELIDHELVLNNNGNIHTVIDN